MPTRRLIATVTASLAAISAFGQAWVTSYSSGLGEARVGHWHAARDEFKQAAANRNDDVSRPTMLPGSPTEPRKWRNGAPYSPNFLAAYCEYREGLEVADSVDQTRLLKVAANEFEALLTKNQQSRDAFFFLDLIYTRTGDQTKRQELDARFRQGNLGWKVDEEIVAPEEVAAMGQVVQPVIHVPSHPVAPVSVAPGKFIGSAVQAPGLGGVPMVPDKFALVIGEASGVPFAAQDTQIIRDALVNYGGYSPANVTALVNGTSGQILDAAHQLAARIPQDGVVLVYFVGSGSNVNGKDYLAPSDPSNMVAKSDLYNLFLQRGGRIFSFFEVSRPTQEGSFFGSEPVGNGAVSQMQATIPDSSVTSIFVNGQQVGLYAQAFANVLSDLRSNRIPIYEFGWQLYNMMRRGNTGTSSGASRQIPTLPVLNNLAADARF